METAAPDSRGTDRLRVPTLWAPWTGCIQNPLLCTDQFLFPSFSKTGEFIWSEDGENRAENKQDHRFRTVYLKKKKNMEAEKRQRKKASMAKHKNYLKQTIKASGTAFLEVFHKLLEETNANTDDVFQYLQRVYHAIFFFGHINNPQVNPKDFFPADAWNTIQNVFQRPLAEYNTHLPSQTPYSILLEYITKIHGGRKESILEELEKRNKEFLVNFYKDEKNQLQPRNFALSATVISHSCVNKPNSANTYGSSIAYKGTVPRQIMIAISALLVWDKVISYEVRCKESGRGIQFPNDVCCDSYKFKTSNNKYKPVCPCTKCYESYIVKFDPKFVKTDKQEDWPHGNCAETESLSNLLRDNEDIRNAVHTYDNNKEIVNRENIIKRFANEHEDELQKEVKRLLESCRFHVNQNGLELFTPAAFAYI
ncbi:uncharacterized protein [Aquarana catesbeiana]|uniref:uncharacterized protein n=1 Tax=Aquarana catesbeiana TaxID=8400 RepID=UPI003CC92B8F